MDPWTNRVLEQAELHRGPPTRPPFAALPWFDEPYRGPELAFDFTRVADRIRGVQRLEQEFECRFMLAVKSFDHPRVLEFFVGHGIGFDISNRAEFDAVTRAGAAPRTLSLTGPFLHSVFEEMERSDLEGMQVNVASLEQYERVPRTLPIVLGMRINASSGARSGRSRMGFMPAPLEDLQVVARDPRFRGIHLHVNNDKDGYYSKVDAALTWLSQTGVEIEYLNLGGGLEHFSLDELGDLIRKVRTMLPRGVQLQFEPGYFWVHGAGYARTRVLDVAPSYLPDAHKVTLDISRVCHLQWSMPALLCEAGWEGETERIIFYGPTCLDMDIVTAASVPLDSRGRLMIRVGDEIVLTHVSGYSAMWNRGFNGISAAALKFEGLG